MRQAHRHLSEPASLEPPATELYADSDADLRTARKRQNEGDERLKTDLIPLVFE